ncbi:MAG: hypothetical protein AB8C46_22050 [Burkholderiaceae bacterium]
MIIILRVVFALGLLTSLLFAVAYMRSGKRKYLINALQSLIVTGVLAVLFFAGMFIERLFS